MIIQNHNGFTEITGCKALCELYAERDRLGDMPVILVHADDMEDTVSEETAAWFMDVPFITVIAAEDTGRFSYNLMSLFDVRLGGNPYPAASAEADERYRFLCGDTAYEMLSAGKTENAPNFVTVLSDDEGFSAVAVSYLEHICSGRTSGQLSILTGCLKAASKGGTEAVLSAESNGFYALMAQKTEEQSDE